MSSTNSTPAAPQTIPFRDLDGTETAVELVKQTKTRIDVRRDGKVERYHRGEPGDVVLASLFEKVLPENARAVARKAAETVADDAAPAPEKPKRSRGKAAEKPAPEKPAKNPIRPGKGLVRWCNARWHEGANPLPFEDETHFRCRKDGTAIGWCVDCAREYRRMKSGKSERTFTPINPEHSAAMSGPRTDVPDEDLRAVYEFVLGAWATGRKEILEGTGLEDAAVSRAIRALESGGLLASTHVNGEAKLTYQTNFDVENDKAAKRKGKAELTRWLKARAAEKAEREERKANGNGNGKPAAEPAATAEKGGEQA